MNLVTEYKNHKITIFKIDGSYRYSIKCLANMFEMERFRDFVAQETACREAMKIIDYLLNDEEG